MTAKEARELTDNKYKQQLKEIYAQINEAANKCDITIRVAKFLHEKTINALKNDGYEVTLMGSSYYLIEW